jgi:hypothetical protein
MSDGGTIDYIVVTGNRRFAAAKAAGLAEIPAHVVADDRVPAEIAIAQLHENEVRSAMSVADVWEAIATATDPTIQQGTQLSTEAIALLMGRVASEPEFLSEYAGVSPLELAGHSGALRRHQSFSMLTFTRWVLVMTHFERELYANPRRADLNELWWNLREKYQGVRRPEGRRSADWAAKIHFAIAPVYYHNYLLGELLASQLRERLYLESQSNTLVDNLYAGEWLISNFFASGNSLSWQDHIQKTLGETLKPDAFLRDYIRQ